MHKKNPMPKWVFIVLIPFFLFAEKAAITPELEVDEPWLTGPLFAPTAIVVPIGHYNFEPYFYTTANIGLYNESGNALSTEIFWNNYFQPYTLIGLSSWMDLYILPTFNYNYCDGSAKWSVGDPIIGIDFQLFKRGSSASWLSALKLNVREQFPLGKYQNLNPAKRKTDVGGFGSWQTSANLVWGNLWKIGHQRYFDTRFSFTYTIPTSVSVSGFNSYGGGYGAKGTVIPPQNFEIDIGMELTLTKKWVYAMDIIGSWSGRTHFKGNPGTTVTGVPSKNGAPHSIQYSLAPAMEYNWNENLGVIGGAWFSFSGRNATRFISGVFAINYYQ